MHVQTIAITELQLLQCIKNEIMVCFLRQYMEHFFITKVNMFATYRFPRFHNYLRASRNQEGIVRIIPRIYPELRDILKLVFIWRIGSNVGSNLINLLILCMS